MRRLFSDHPLAVTGARATLDPHESHHGRDVLRLRPGDSILVFDSQGRQFEATVEGASGERMALVLGAPVPAAPETPAPIALYLALSKGAAFEGVLQKAVELGAAAIVPFTAERSVVTLETGAALEAKMARWRQIALAATKQCGRARLTAIGSPRRFEEAARQPRSVALCCAPGPGSQALSQALRRIELRFADSVALMIGPEGGLTEREIELAISGGWQRISLGPRILRVETAATAVLTLILASLGEM